MATSPGEDSGKSDDRDERVSQGMKNLFDEGSPGEQGEVPESILWEELDPDQLAFLQREMEDEFDVSFEEIAGKKGASEMLESHFYSDIDETVELNGWEVRLAVEEDRDDYEFNYWAEDPSQLSELKSWIDDTLEEFSQEHRIESTSEPQRLGKYQDTEIASCSLRSQKMPGKTP